MSGGRWRLQHVDDELSDDGFESFQIVRISEDDSEVVLQAWSEADARYAITALRWYDTFSDKGVSIPKPQAAPKRRQSTRSKA